MNNVQRNQLAITLMNKLDKLVKMNRHILVAEDILVETVNEWREAQTKSVKDLGNIDFNDDGLD